MSQLIQNLNSMVNEDEALIKEYLSLAFLLDEHECLIQESFEVFLKTAYSVIKDEGKDDKDSTDEAKDNLAKILVGLLQWKSAGVRGKDYALYQQIQTRLAHDHLDSAKELGEVDKNKKLLKLIRDDLDNDKQKVHRIIDDLKNYYSRSGVLKKANTILDLSSN